MSRGAAPACERMGDGSPVVLVHGVGVGPWSYRALARDLAGDHTVVLAHRRGYGASAGMAPPASLEAQVDDLLGLAGGPAAFVGVSGGATLTLAVAIACPEAVSAAVVHEPVLGALAPELHAELVDAGARLLSSTGLGGTEAFMRALVGPQTWASLRPSDVADVMARDGAIRHEVPQFLAFAPTREDLARLAGGRLVSSVGGRSRRSRRLAAAALAACLAGPTHVIPGVGHLAQLEAPAALAAALRAAERGAFDGRADGDDEVLAAGWGDHLQADG
ncbi:MAG TPA: alpha/beta fold hydrolase [Acidimicrobiales bacterium]|nr:alpha/beta fold hydrolase [Acidimicrobiales bacterium]